MDSRAQVVFKAVLQRPIASCHCIMLNQYESRLGKIFLVENTI